MYQISLWQGFQFLPELLIEELSTAISMREGELKIAKKLKEANVSYDIISKSTGLSTEEIVKL